MEGLGLASRRLTGEPPVYWLEPAGSSAGEAHGGHTQNPHVRTLSTDILHKICTDGYSLSQALVLAWFHQNFIMEFYFQWKLCSQVGQITEIGQNFMMWVG